jgi:hypothetical protein
LALHARIRWRRGWIWRVGWYGWRRQRWRVGHVEVGERTNELEWGKDVVEVVVGFARERLVVKLDPCDTECRRGV